MERQDDKPRAYPEREAGRRDEAVPREESAAADADREYTDTSREGTDHNYVDPSGEYSESGRDESVEAVPASETEPARHAGSEEYASGRRTTDAEDVSRSEPGYDAGTGTHAERDDYAAREPAGAASAPGEAGPDERRAYGGPDAATADAAAGTNESPALSRAGAPAEDPAYARTADQPAGTATTQREAAYDAAAERKAVTPPDAETRPADASTVDAEGRGDQAALGTQAAPGAVTLVEETAVLSPDDARSFQVRWETIQGTFIDDPHAATEQADALVGEVMDRLARLREDYLRQLRGALGDGSDTEAMRVALQRYRAFFQMLLG